MSDTQTPAGPLKRAVVYLRVSTNKQVGKSAQDADGYSLPAQKEACYRKAAELGAEVIAEYIDRGESAKTVDRRQFQAMIARIKAEKDADYVIVHKIDRANRNSLEELQMDLEIRNTGAELISVMEHIDNSPSGRLMHVMLAGIAEFHSRNLATEVMKGMTEKAKQGGTPGRPPIGYLNVRQTIDGREVNVSPWTRSEHPLCAGPSAPTPPATTRCATSSMS